MLASGKQRSIRNMTSRGSVNWFFELRFLNPKFWSFPIPGNSAGGLFGMVKTWPFKRLLVTSICIKLSSCPEQFAEKTLCYTKAMMLHKRRIAFRMPPKRTSAHLPWSGWRLVHGPLTGRLCQKSRANNVTDWPWPGEQSCHCSRAPAGDSQSCGRSCGPERCPHIEQPPWQGPQFFSFRRGVPDECQLDPEDARHSWSYVDLLRQWRAKGKSRKGKTIENPLVEACTCRGQTAKLFTEVRKLLQKAVAKAEDVIHVQAFDVHREKQQAVEDDPSLVSFCVFFVFFCVFFVSSWCLFVSFLCLCVSFFVSFCIFFLSFYGLILFSIMFHIYLGEDTQSLTCFVLKDWLSHHLAIMNDYTGFCLKTPFALNFILSREPGFYRGFKFIGISRFKDKLQYFNMQNSTPPDPFLCPNEWHIPRTNHIWPGRWDWDLQNFYPRKGVWILRLQRYVVVYHNNMLSYNKVSPQK